MIPPAFTQHLVFFYLSFLFFFYCHHVNQNNIIIIKLNPKTHSNKKKINVGGYRTLWKNGMETPEKILVKDFFVVYV